MGEACLELYTRLAHGNHRVRCLLDDHGATRFELHRSDGIRVYPSARQLIASLYGRPKSMTFDQYFRIGRYRKSGRPSGAADLFQWFGRPRADVARIETPIVVQGPESRNRSTGLVFAPSGEDKASTLGPRSVGFEPPEALAREIERSIKLELDRVEGIVGFDLAAKSGRAGARTKADEVRKLLWAGFAGKMLSQGYDPEDVLQEVHRGLLVRNRGKCPWDSRKSTFAHYIHMCIGSILTNHHRKEQRRLDRDAEEIEVEDRSRACAVWFGSELGDEMAQGELARYLDMGEDLSPEAVLAKRMLPLINAGHSRQEIAKVLETKASNVSRALTWLRRRAADWAREAGMTGILPARYREAEVTG